MKTATVETMENKLWTLMSERLGLEKDQIKITDSFTDDLGVDSLDLTALIVEVEKEFGVKISEEAAEKMHTVKSLVDYLRMQLS